MSGAKNKKLIELSPELAEAFHRYCAAANESRYGGSQYTERSLMQRAIHRGIGKEFRQDLPLPPLVTKSESCSVGAEKRTKQRKKSST